MGKAINLLSLILLLFGVVIVTSSTSKIDRVFANSPLYEQSLAGTYTTSKNYKYVPSSYGYCDNPDSSSTTVSLSSDTKFQILDFIEDYSGTSSKLTVKFINGSSSTIYTSAPIINYGEYEPRIRLLDNSGNVIYTEAWKYGIRLSIDFSRNVSKSTTNQYDIYFDKTKKIKDIYIDHYIHMAGDYEGYTGPWTFCNGSTGTHSGSIIRINTSYNSGVITPSSKINVGNLYNQVPTLTLTTPNKQVLSNLNGNNTLQLNGSVTDSNVDDSILIKYSIEGLSGHQNKVLP
ncbi:hypothetical protein ACFSCX_06710 [Bacillus salitolerans]|uniref:Uncharacterized protein n=1 Tax=Bacillus salitolerans TaxID=1437434 RepID=A0ABW4LQ72_9BACI